MHGRVVIQCIYVPQSKHRVKHNGLGMFLNGTVTYSVRRFSQYRELRHIMFWSAFYETTLRALYGQNPRLAPYRYIYIYVRVYIYIRIHQVYVYLRFIHVRRYFVPI